MSVTAALGVRSYRELLAGDRGAPGGLVGPAGADADGDELARAGAARARRGPVVCGRGHRDGQLRRRVGVGAVVGGRLVDRRRPAGLLVGYGIAYGLALAGLLALAHAGAPVAALTGGALARGAAGAAGRADDPDDVADDAAPPRAAHDGVRA